MFEEKKRKLTFATANNDLVVRAAEVAQTSEVSGSFWQIGRTQRETAMIPGAVYAP